MYFVYLLLKQTIKGPSYATSGGAEGGVGSPNNIMKGEPIKLEREIKTWLKK